MVYPRAPRLGRSSVFRTESAVQSSRGQALGDYVPCRMRPEKAIHCSPRFYIGSIILTAAVRRGYYYGVPRRAATRINVFCCICPEKDNSQFYIRIYTDSKFSS